jgi:hypothetical protein
MCEIDRGVLQDRARPSQLGVLLAKAVQLLALLARQQVAAATRVSLGSAGPKTERLIVDAEITRPPAGPGGPTRRRAEPLAPSTPTDTSLRLACSEHLLSPGRRLVRKPPEELRVLHRVDTPLTCPLHAGNERLLGDPCAARGAREVAPRSLGIASSTSPICVLSVRDR